MNQTTPSLPLYEHEKRPEWGPALLAWKREDRRGYLFEDGTLRVFAEPYCHQLKLRHGANEPLSPEFEQHVARLALAEASQPGAADPRTATFSVDEQAQLLLADFPGGFSGERWGKTQRGTGVKKPLKRHRDPVVSDAQSTLAPQRLARALEQGSHVELWREVCAMLRRTNLVPPHEVRMLEKHVSKANSSLTGALAAMLAPTSEKPKANDPARRFDAFVAELRKLLGGGTPTWSMVTALLALYDPKEHFCVHPTTTRLQGQWMKMRPLRSKKPTATDYEQARQMARTIATKLDELGLPAKDLLDVYDFMRHTSAPAARTRLVALHHTPVVMQEAAARPAALEEPVEEVSGTHHARPEAPDSSVAKEVA